MNMGFHGHEIFNGDDFCASVNFQFVSYWMMFKADVEINVESN